MELTIIIIKGKEKGSGKERTQISWKANDLEFLLTKEDAQNAKLAFAGLVDKLVE
jgi:hypothetical protein